MADCQHGYERGWHRYAFNSTTFTVGRIHNGSVDCAMSIIINRGPLEPCVGFFIVPPGSEAMPIGMHIHRDRTTGKDLEEWYLIIDGTGVQRFTNGDSVEFGPGDLIACYPGTGHSLEVTGDRPVRFIAILPKMFAGDVGTVERLPDSFSSRINVVSANEAQNPLTARCSDCGATWERPDDDPGSNGLSIWAGEHACTRDFQPLHLAAVGRRAGTGWHPPDISGGAMDA